MFSEQTQYQQYTVVQVTAAQVAAPGTVVPAWIAAHADWLVAVIKVSTWRCGTFRWGPLTSLKRFLNASFDRQSFL